MKLWKNDMTNKKLIILVKELSFWMEYQKC
uniref:Uncharacterized protein n=1 Tax=viral metagenome TaxID=1070528 RepID=A0A6C0CBD8_9ZZZZ